MCGIAGILSSQPCGIEHIHAMTRVQSHRGPDGEGYWDDLDGRLRFGHRRLSIIDLDSGAQPIADATGRAVITFNGEIYNYAELRSELEARGVRFLTHSDTEVLLNAYLTWGSNCLNRLRGMFAFAIWDRKERRIFIARDHVGIKPLHYSLQEDTLLFSSELKGITAFSGTKRKVDPTALGLYLRLGYIPAPHTIYRDCFKLKPGHFMEAWFEGDRLVTRIERYWNFEFATPPAITSEGECLSRVDQVLYDSVSYHMVSDVPIGFFLSGGIDSSLVSYFGAKLSPVPIHTFSMGFNESEYNELPFAEEVAGKIGSEHHTEILTSESVESTVDRLVRMFDEPFADSSALPTYYVCRALGGKVKVALSGDGGDEIWGGYKRYLATLQYRNELAHGSGSLKKKVALALSRVSPFDYKREAIEYFAQSPIERYLYSMHLFFRESAIGELLRAPYRDAPVPDYLGSLLEKGDAGDDILDTIQRLDILSYLPEDNLTKVDRTSMANSLEVRVPLLDIEVLGLTRQVSSNLRVKPTGSNGHTEYSERSLKYPLRRLAERYLGEKIAYRNKKGFSVPLNAWFRDRALGDLLLQRMHAIEECDDLFDTKYVETLIEEHRAGRKNHQTRLWSLLVLFSWWNAMKPEV
jgi:asparagine synthase (glutamine-hydrolysing)